jgi:chromosome segregation ATPase
MTAPRPPASTGHPINPRNRNSISQRQSAHSARSRPVEDLIEESPFLMNIDAYFERELPAAHSSSDRIHIYQAAFDLLTQEFQLCRPLLERIQQQYDEMSKSLLAKKRVIMTDSSSVSATEDSFSENVNRMRRARIEEFGSRRATIERLLDEMTDLRVQRSDLQKRLDAMATQRSELKMIEAEHSERMTQVNSRVHELMDDIKQMEGDSFQTKREIQQLQEKIEKTMISANDLQQSDEQLGKDLSKIEELEAELNAELNRVTKEHDAGDLQLEELHREIRTLSRENSELSEKAKSITDRRHVAEMKIREMLIPYDNSPHLPLLSLVKRIVSKRNR